MASLQLDALRLTPDRCGLQAQSLQSTCLQATLSGSYAHIKSFLNDLQSRHPNQLIVRSLRMQQRDATLGTVSAEVDLLLIGGDKAVEGRGVPSEAVRATP